MMFGRQWFPNHSQYGLSHSALKFEEALANKDYSTAKALVFLSYLENPSYWQRMWARYRRVKARKDDLSGNVLTYTVFGFWPEMDPVNCQIVDFFKHAYSSISWQFTQDPKCADIVFVSCYAPDYRDFFSCSQHALRVLFLGENVRPYFLDYDLSLSFDQSEYSARNIYLPLWMFEVDWFNKGSYPDRRPHPLQDLASDRIVEMYDRLPRICYIGNNNEPQRMNLIEAIKSEGIPVDCYGSHSRPITDKIELLRRYRVLLSPENSFYPGYTTEKPIHGFISGCKTIYWGYPDKLLNIEDNAGFICLDTTNSMAAQMCLIKAALRAEKPYKLASLLRYDEAWNRFNLIIRQIQYYLDQFI
jgi:hypothetical protein